MHQYTNFEYSIGQNSVFCRDLIIVFETDAILIDHLVLCSLFYSSFYE